MLMLMMMMWMWMRMLMLVRMLVWMRMLLLPGYLDLHVVLRIRGAASRQRQVKTFAACVRVCASLCVCLCVREGVFVSAAPAPGGRMACAQYHLRIATDRGACGQWQAWPTLWHAARIKFHALLRG